MRQAAIIVVCMGLAACGGEEHQDLREWMKESTKDLKGKVLPLPPMKSFHTVAYVAGDQPDPFAPSKIEPERKAGAGWGIKPDLDRRKEPLEFFPLESLKMVGTLMKGKMVHALIQADKNLLQVKIGNYVGQNFGIITDIKETEVTLKELIPDALGEYYERTSTLHLQEQQEVKK